MAEKKQKNYFGIMENESFFVHPSSVIDDGAKIGAGTKIWHFCHLMPTSIIGENCILGQNVFIDNNVVIGNGVKIQNNVSVYNGVIVEDDVFLGPSVVFTNVLNPRSFIERKNEFKKTLIKKGASIGANATLLCGIEVGRYAMIGAGSVVTKNVTDYALMLGNPARQVGWVSEAAISLEFDGNNKAICSATGQVYKLENNNVFREK
jgi:UDP-2-acetamido-3-amino-2,3-dideoxy-glucuronate N-acetyltransferase